MFSRFIGLFDHDEIHLPSLEILTCTCTLARAHTHTHTHTQMVYYVHLIWQLLLGLLYISSLNYYESKCNKIAFIPTLIYQLQNIAHYILEYGFTMHFISANCICTFIDVSTWVPPIYISSDLAEGCVRQNMLGIIKYN
jgi:hypothetical protein